MTKQQDHYVLKRYSNEVKFLVFFPVVFFILYYLYFMIPDLFLTKFIYHNFIVSISSWIINFISSIDTATMAIDNKLISNHTTLSIVRGCDGAGATFLLMAAILAFSAPMKNKLLGLVGSIILIYIINQIRLIGLYYIIVYEYDWFQIVHTYLAPSIIIIINCIFFLWWLKKSLKSRVDSDKRQPV